MGYIVMLVFGMTSIAYAWVVLSKPGISSGCRTLILKRHAAGITVFFITFFYVFVYSVYTCWDIDLEFTTEPIW